MVEMEVEAEEAAWHICGGGGTRGGGGGVLFHIVETHIMTF